MKPSCGNFEVLFRRHCIKRLLRSYETKLFTSTIAVPEIYRKEKKKNGILSGAAKFQPSPYKSNEPTFPIRHLYRKAGVFFRLFLHHVLVIPIFMLFSLSVHGYLIPQFLVTHSYFPTYTCK